MHNRNEHDHAGQPASRNSSTEDTNSGLPGWPSLPISILGELFTTNQLGIAVLRLGDAVILEVNNAWQAMFGFGRQEVLGRTLTSLALWKTEEDACHFKNQVLKEGRVNWLEQDLLTRSGEELVSLVSGEVIRKDGESAIITIWRDITRRKRTERDLEEKEHLLSESQRIAHVGSWTYTIHDDSVRWSDETYRIYGVDPNCFVPTAESFIKLIHPEDQGMMQEWIRACLAGENPGELECRIVSSEGTIKTVNGRGALELSPEGKPLRIMGTVQDITERKRAEEALREANTQLETRVEQRTADLAQRATHLRALASELTISEQRERERLARVLHDNLQQLLVAAKFGLVDLQHHIDPVVRQARERVERLLNESIQIARSLTAELSPPVLHEHGLSAGLEWLARWMANKYGVSVNLFIREALPKLADMLNVLLFESVRELLFNAVKHAKVQEVRVDLYCLEDGRLRIMVSDRGAGFDPDKVKKTGEHGEGFGLFSIHERLTLIGGRMEIDSAPGKGSRITLLAPVSAPSEITEPEKEMDQAELRPAARRTLDKLGAPIRVLLADDHAVMREGLARLLAREPDIEVLGEAASTGKEAVDLSSRLTPDVVLMDISMPEMNGIEATRTINREHPEIRIIGLSMFEQEESANAMLNAGAVGYLSKSGPSAELISAIRASIVG